MELVGQLSNLSLDVDKTHKLETLLYQTNEKQKQN